MKTLITILVAVLVCAQAIAFAIDTSPERLKANKAWEKQLRKEFDLSALRTFLIQTVAEQKQFDGVDLTASLISEKWQITSYDRRITCGNWSLTREAKSLTFQLRYFPGKGDRDVVLVCERADKKSFRLVEIKWEPMEVWLSRNDASSQLAEPLTLVQGAHTSRVLAWTSSQSRPIYTQSHRSSEIL